MSDKDPEKKRARAREYNRRYRVRHADKIRAARRAQYAADPERHRNYNRRYSQTGRRRLLYRANCEKHKARVRAWKLANPGTRRAAAQRWRAANPEKVRAYARRWAADNQEKAKRWSNENPVRARQAKTRSQRERRNGKKLDKHWNKIAEAARSLGKQTKGKNK